MPPHTPHHHKPIRHISSKAGLVIGFLTLAALTTPCFGADEEKSLETLKEMSIEGLLGLEVTSVSKKAQKLWGTAAAIHVIDQEDIRRSGATSIPEALRLAPGINVAKINANSWAITARGFNGRFSNKLLVLIDGRSVYTPLYSGVYWDVQDTLISDIERIEVIRGPGATIWGANAVNGVINIITRSSHDTQGGHLQARIGNEERTAGEFRHGAALSDSTSFRIYGKSFKRDSSVDTAGNDAFDEWDSKQIGFRLDSEISPTDSLRLQGDFYQGDSGQTITVRTGDFADVAERSGGNILLSWSRILGEESGLNLKAYADRTEREDAVTEEKRNTFDIDFNHYFSFGDRQHINWGLGYRRSSDEVKQPTGSSISLNPSERTIEIWSGFLQDEIVLLPERLTTTWGAKVEHNSYTGWEFQPSARLNWTPEETLTLWGAVSGSIRSPSRIESDVRIQIPSFPASYAILGNTALVSEKMTAYEIGLRKKISEGLSFDATAFYSRYQDLRSIEFLGTTIPNTPPFFLPAISPAWIVNQFGNGIMGNTRGLELTSDWKVNKDWRLKGSYSWLDVDLKLKPGSTDTLSLPITNNSPEHQFYIQSMWDIRHNLEFDTTLYYTGHLDSEPVPAHTRVDLRLSWFPSKTVEATFVIQNLFDNQHPEFSIDEGLRAREVERGIYGQVTCKY
jgi:iron complex outermembrane receptor protein